MTFNNLSEVWSYYDVKDRKHFDNHDLCAAIAPLKEGPEQIPANHELLAFNFVASTRHQPNEWGTFYTCQFAGKNKNNEVEDLMSLFEGRTLVNDNTRALLRRGMEAYLAGDDIACCHILVPQFEAMMRFLVAINGGEVLRQAKDPAEGNEYYSLESLLDSPTAKAVLPEDVLLYFKVLFVSQAGWNVRNSISHGLMLARSFNHALSDRVVHAILVLSQIRVREE